MGEEFQKLDIEINYLYIAYGQSGKQLWNNVMTS
jgi:hypothetical protein